MTTKPNPTGQNRLWNNKLRFPPTVRVLGMLEATYIVKLDGENALYNDMSGVDSCMNYKT